MTTQQLAAKYVELINLATSAKKKAEIADEWFQKHLRLVFKNRDDLKETLQHIT